MKRMWDDKDFATINNHKITEGGNVEVIGVVAVDDNTIKQEVGTDKLYVDRNVIQSKLTAGQNITIENNIISATGGGSEPAAYLKSASVLGNKLTLVNKDDTELEYEPIIPTKTSDLINDSGFLTEHQSLAAYRTSADQDLIDAEKQHVLTAGANITIVDNVISATGGSGSYTAGSGIDITGTVISNTGVLSVNGSTGTITGLATSTDLQQGLATKMTVGSVSGTAVDNKWTSITIEGVTNAIPIQPAIPTDLPVSYTDVEPVTDNPNGLIVVQLSAEPAQKYNGYIYMIEEA